MPPQNNYLVLSALGKDRPGIVDELSGAIFDLNCNITDSRMTVLGGHFAILMLIDGPWNQLAKLEGQLSELRKALSLTIVAERTQARARTGDSIPYRVEVVSLDHPGIVHNLANFFSRQSINIEDMSTSCYAAPHTGTPMFALYMDIGVPMQVHISQLRDEFMDFCDSLNLDAVMEPIKG